MDSKYWRPVLAALLLALGRGLCPASAAETAAPDSLQQLTPRGALLRSAVLPGWGQYYNKRPLKALFFGAATAGFLGATLVEIHSLSQARTPEDHQDRAARRNTRFLYLLGTATFAALDAYVDAHLADVEIAPTLEVESGAASLRLRISWSP